jgi:hypothetical protein
MSMWLIWLRPSADFATQLSPNGTNTRTQRVKSFPDVARQKNVLPNPKCAAPRKMPGMARLVADFVQPWRCLSFDGHLCLTFQSYMFLFFIVFTVLCSGHFCFGYAKEAVCPPCLHPDCEEQALVSGIHQTADNECNICFSEGIFLFSMYSYGMCLCSGSQPEFGPCFDWVLMKEELKNKQKINNSCVCVECEGVHVCGVSSFL